MKKYKDETEDLFELKLYPIPNAKGDKSVMDYEIPPGPTSGTILEKKSKKESKEIPINKEKGILKRYQKH